MASLKKKMMRTAGDMLGGYLDSALKLGGQVGQAGATAALDYGMKKFAPNLAGKTGKEIPKFLRNSPTSTIPKAGKMLGQGAVLAAGLGAASMIDDVFDQQSNYSQPMSSGTGNQAMDNFLMSQQLQNQKFMNDMALVQARAESRIPGAQLGGSLRDAAEAERLLTESGEVTNREVLGVARSLYGTGLRA